MTDGIYLESWLSATGETQPGEDKSNHKAERTIEKEQEREREKKRERNSDYSPSRGSETYGDDPIKLDP